MRKKINVTVLAGFVSLLTFSILLPGCGKKTEETETKAPQALMIVFSTGATILRDGQKLAADVGKLVLAGDTIKTEKGFVDLQTREGSAIRISNFTTVAVADLFQENTRLDMKHGTVIAKIERSSSKENFSITTPTAIAGVRGTTFKVEQFGENEPPRVKVMEGKVSMSPRITILEKYSKEEIEKNPSLTKLSNIQENGEVILEKEMEGTLSPEVEKQVKEVNSAIAAVMKEEKDLSKIETIQTVATLTTTVEKQKEKSVVVEKSPLDVQDVHQAGTLVSVSEEAFDKIIKNAEAEKNIVAVDELKKSHEEKRKQNQETIIAKIEKEASSKQLKNEEEIKKQYNKLEMVILKDGKKITGAVIATTDNVIVIHTKEGVQRVNKELVDSQEMLY